MNTTTRPIWSTPAGTDHSTLDPTMRPRGNALVFADRFTVGQIRRAYRTARRAGLPRGVARNLVWGTAWVATLRPVTFIGCQQDNEVTP